MSDIVDRATRSRMMAGIRSRNTKPEMVVRSALHHRGFRFRIDDRSIPGRPDIVLAKYRAVIFIHGCFWHRHEGCKYAATPKTRAEFWDAKFTTNAARDQANYSALQRLGWRVAVVWECGTRTGLDLTITNLVKWLQGQDGLFGIAEGSRDHNHE